MKTAMICAGLLALACAWPARAADVREQSYSIGADVDAQGKVTALQFDDESVPVRKLLTAAVQQWQFVPAKRDGQPVPAHTFIRARIRAIPDAQGEYGLRVSFVGNGPRLERTAAPKYPKDAVRRRQSAFMWLDATVLPDGNLADLKVSRRFDDWPVASSIEQSVLAAARRWRASAEQVDSRPVATHLRVPVTFTLGPDYFTEEQLKILRAAARDEVAKSTVEDVRPGVPLPSDEEVALDSPLQPQSVATIVSGS